MKKTGFLNPNQLLLYRVPRRWKLYGTPYLWMCEQGAGCRMQIIIWTSQSIFSLNKYYSIATAFDENRRAKIKGPIPTSQIPKHTQQTIIPDKLNERTHRKFIIQLQWNQNASMSNGLVRKPKRFPAYGKWTTPRPPCPPPSDMQPKEIKKNANLLAVGSSHTDTRQALSPLVRVVPNEPIIITVVTESLGYAENNISGKTLKKNHPRKT